MRYLHFILDKALLPFLRVKEIAMIHTYNIIHECPPCWKAKVDSNTKKMNNSYPIIREVPGNSDPSAFSFSFLSVHGFGPESTRIM